MALIHPPGLPFERGKIREFANAILDDHPHYHDAEASEAAGAPLEGPMSPAAAHALRWSPAGRMTQDEVLGASDAAEAFAAKRRTRS